ncbi:hypothetical protein FQN54_006180 [Arachnomyces sp. PD_36]|nr:hypothetical protein FQN54_006180 [Arachnomyces sp. PD_36]
MKLKRQDRFRQVSLSSRDGSPWDEPTDTYPKADSEEQEKKYQSTLLRLMPRLSWPEGLYLASCHNPIAITQNHQRQLVELHDALTAAIIDIVERWWTDASARFPERMPLEPQEEDLLQWMQKLSPKELRPFKKCMGSWRPDFLLESHKDLDNKDVVENFRICEINARFCWNGYVNAAVGQQAFIPLSKGQNPPEHATDPEKMFQGLLRIFDPERPLHLLKGEEKGIGIPMFAEYTQRHLGIYPRFIVPADLRLIADTSSKGSYKLCCRISKKERRWICPRSKVFINDQGEMLEEIHQVCLELHQREIRALDPEILRQISTRCFNDMRTILLVHDKRMLGLVLEELKPLARRGILTPKQVDILQNGIATTIIPGSAEMARFITRCQESPSLKDEYILKPIRSGKGAGILFGDELKISEWALKLELLRCPLIAPGLTTYVVQRKISPLTYDLTLRAAEGRVRRSMVGTYHAIHGELIGFGTWRVSKERICAVSHGGAWCCSVVVNC